MGSHGMSIDDRHTMLLADCMTYKVRAGHVWRVTLEAVGPCSSTCSRGLGNGGSMLKMTDLVCYLPDQNLVLWCGWCLNDFAVTSTVVDRCWTAHVLAFAPSLVVDHMYRYSLPRELCSNQHGCCCCCCCARVRCWASRALASPR
jgi:hypothetical protein